MNIIIKTKHFELTDALRAFVNEKIGLLGRYAPRALEARVDLERGTRHHSGDVFRAEIMVYLPKELVRAEETSNDLYAAIDLALPKVKVQLEHYHEKKKGLVRQTRRVTRMLKSIPEYFGYAMEEPAVEISKRKILMISPLSEEEAVVEMNRLKHSFFVFVNSTTGKTSIAYRREAGGYGIIEIAS